MSDTPIFDQVVKDLDLNPLEHVHSHWCGPECDIPEAPQATEQISEVESDPVEQEH